MKKFFWVLILITIIILLFIGLHIYQNITTTPIFVTPIGKIIANPYAFEKKTVNVYGEVTKRNSFVFVKYFLLKDKTGEIAIVTKNAMPSKGTKLKVKGRVKESFSIGDYQLLVIVQEDIR